MARKARKPDNEEPAFDVEDVDFDALAEDEDTASAEPVRPGRKPRVDTEAKHDMVQETKLPEVAAKRPRFASVTRDKAKKLTKKEKEHYKENFTGDNRKKNVDAMFGAVLNDVKRKYGSDKALSANSLNNLIRCIPCPALPMEYLLGMSGFPLHLIMHINGPPSSLKSSLFFEIARWFNLADGRGVLMEVESKISPTLLPSIIGYDASEHAVMVHNCDSVEEWMKMLDYWMAELRKLMLKADADNPGIGLSVPIVFGVDTITGKASSEFTENMRKSGGDVGRSHPVEALKISKYMQYIPSKLVESPYALILLNHAKVGQNSRGQREIRTPGGQSVGFQESFEIRSRVVQHEISCKSWEGRVIELQTIKNSFGQDKRKIQTRMLWWRELDDTEDSGFKQYTVWDWDWSTVKMLSSMEGPDKQRLKDMDIHIETPKVSAVENLAWSKTLGMSAKDAVPWSDMGAMISQNYDMVSRIRKALGIAVRPYLANEFHTQLDDMMEQID